MTFLSSFEVVHYRGVDGLSLPRLAPANLITGANGIGKTALIEAMWLFSGRYNVSLLWNMNVQRSASSGLNPITRLTRDRLVLQGCEEGSNHRLEFAYEKRADNLSTRATLVDPSAKHSIPMPPVVGRIRTKLDNADNDSKDQELSGLHVTPYGTVVFEDLQPPALRPNCTIIGTRFQSESLESYLQRYSDMVRGKYKKDFIDAMNLILPKVNDVEILADEMGESYISAATTDGQQCPIQDLGGGVVRLYQMFLSLFSSREGALFADEIENGLHYSVLEDVWRHARTWMRKWNVQLVATTHSYECIRAAMAAFRDAPRDLAIHKLYRNRESGEVQAATFTDETLEGARDLGLEIR